MAEVVPGPRHEPGHDALPGGNRLTTHVFVGPTLPPGEVLQAAGGSAVVHPPVQHGDLLRLSPSPGDIVVVIDGYYHQRASVRHKEILHLLSAGVTVVGCASMGALRAAELHPYGMAGSGRVYEMYRDGLIDADDEVAVAHTEGPEYRSLSLPLVNVRHAVAAAERAGAVSSGQAGTMVAAMRALPYPARTWQAIAPQADGVAAVRNFLADNPQHADLKAADAVGTLLRLDSFAAPDPRAHDWIASTGWRTRFLYDWHAAFRGAEVEGIHVGDAGVVRHRQIYDRDFPRRRRDHVFTSIAGSRSPAKVLSAVAARGLTAESVTAAQRAEWLTPAEADRLSPDEALLTILIRSHKPSRGIHDLVSDERTTITTAERRLVAECYAINAEVSTWEPGRGLDYLRYVTLRAHLSEVWGEDDGAALVAAARDRGFRTFRDAVQAVRPFYLRGHFMAVGA
ncbi:TfuA-like protein [Nonomuraea sp. NPDC005650]|uniref:TfuA-like protein n=1 Tax=Nonomuraea sp. NPDC005650 TaxID=3157045 RepID=UPI0033AFA07D